jgi:hypothetical protein
LWYYKNKGGERLLKKTNEGLSERIAFCLRKNEIRGSLI